MELRVPHVTSYARAPSSLLFLRSARYPQSASLFAFFREFWPMPIPLMNHSALALYAQRTRIPTSARSIGFCVIWVCVSSSSSGTLNEDGEQTGCNSVVSYCFFILYVAVPAGSLGNVLDAASNRGQLDCFIRFAFDLIFFITGLMVDGIGSLREEDIE